MLRFVRWLFGWSPPQPAVVNSTDGAIHQFWSWWRAHQGALLNLIEGGTQDPVLVQQLSAHVQDIGGPLAWEFGAGKRAKHRFVVSGEGNANLRILAERWEAEAPTDDPDFEFYASRQPIFELTDGMAVRFGPQEFAYRDFRYAVDLDEQRCAIDVVVHHPSFEGLTERQRQTPLFITLDNIIGEDAVETWIRAIQPSPEPAPPDALDAVAFRQLIEDVANVRWKEGRGLVGQFKDPEGYRKVIRFNVPRRRWNHPFHDTVAHLSFRYDGNDEGMPEPEQLELLQDLEEQLETEIGALTVHLATVTGRHTRDIYLALRGDNGPAAAGLRDLARDYGRASVTVLHDPAWENAPRP
ncbi:MAG: hypothetical protein AAGA48_30150 [Myxococcota bacterium]